MSIDSKDDAKQPLTTTRTTDPIERSANLDDDPPVLTVEAVREAIAKAAPGANEVNGELRELFALSDASSTLRLR